MEWSIRLLGLSSVHQGLKLRPSVVLGLCSFQSLKLPTTWESGGARPC